MSGLVQEIAQVASDRPEPFAIVTPLGNVGDRVLLDAQALQPGHCFRIRFDFRVSGLKVIGHDLEGPAVAM
jgi:hypothetical protein